MCIFSQPVRDVSATRIFARPAGETQILVYSMDLSAARDVAMVLPLPVPRTSGEDTVRFIDLSGYPSLFEDLDRGFFEPVSSGLATAGLMPDVQTRLVVHQVGDFEASFVPSPADFRRLDPRFRLGPRSLRRLAAHAAEPPEPERPGPNHIEDYRDYGFVVFQLRGFGGRFRARWWSPRKKADKRQFHPMAFEFTRRHPSHLFLPTVHMHGRRVPRRAEFDHVLYCQADEVQGARLDDWQASWAPASGFVDVARTRGTIASDEHVYRLRVVGELPNLDSFVGNGRPAA